MPEDKPYSVNSLCSFRKIDRDSALTALAAELRNKDSSFSDLEAGILDRLSDTSASWEAKHGCLCAAKLLLATCRSGEPFVQGSQRIASTLLTDTEARVRLAAGEVLGELCRLRGPQIYEKMRTQVFDLIERNLERCADDIQPDDPVLQKLQQSQNDPILETGEKHLTAAQIFHDTAGWKELETSMKCLESMIRGCGKDFLPFIDRPLLNVLFTSLRHTNRFVRETGFNACGALAACHDGRAESSVIEFGPELAQHLSEGLTDNWSQVRMAGSVANRQFLTSLNSEQRSQFLPKLIGPMCLNRYYLAEGVRLYNQETWRSIVGDQGRQLVADHLDVIVPFYISQTEADNHAVREAACQSMAELALKVDHDSVSNYVLFLRFEAPKFPQVRKFLVLQKLLTQIDKEKVRPHTRALLTALTVCFNDQSWPVRDTACLACGNFISCFPEECRSDMSTLYPLFLTNLSDCIASVRHGAAESLAKVLATYGDEAVDFIWPKIEAGLVGIKDQPESSPSDKLGDMDTGLTVYGIARRIHDNDRHLHTDQTMYSCGSLAPKMKRGGGCMDHSFRKPNSPWHVTDGFFHLIAELATVDEKLLLRVAGLVPKMVEACRKRTYVQHVVLLESLCRRLPALAKALGKRHFKPLIEMILEPIFYSLSCDCQLTEVAAEQCIQGLAQFLGPNILRGRIEMTHPEHVEKYDSILLRC